MGSCLAYVAEESLQKPRMAIESFRHEETYHPEALKPAIDAYDRTFRSMAGYWARRRAVMVGNMALHYGRFSRLIRSVAEKQGFTIEV